MDLSLVRKILRDLFRNDHIDYGSARILTLAHDTDRGYFFCGKHYSPSIDTLQEDLAARGINCISISRIASRIKGEKSHGKVFSPEGKFARALLRKHIKARFFKGKYPYSYSEERVWGEILDKCRIEKVVGILPSRELCVACRKRNIWVADVQHGVIAENHPWYGGKFRGDDPTEQLPNSFLVWDEGSADVLRSWCGPKGVDVKVIGNRWLRRFDMNKPSDQLVQQAKGAFITAFEKEFNSSKPTVLVSLSWGEKGIPNGIISDELINVIQKTSDLYNWLLRLHPNVVKGFAREEFKKFIEIYNKLLIGHAKWELATSSALPVVLAHCDLHISWNSSVCIEGAQVGVRSALLDPRFYSDFAGDYYHSYHESGFVDFLHDNSQLISEWVEKNAGVKLKCQDYKMYDQNYEQLLNFLVAE